MTKIATAALRAAVCLAAGGLLSACTTSQTTASVDKSAKTTKLAAAGTAPAKQVYSYTSADRECLKRAMYFESKRTSENGFLAVGSVIMNRLTSGIYPSTICGVVKQEKQFAPGVMTRKMEEETAPALNQAADAVLKGERHPDVKSAMFFHQKGLTFPYGNMHYVASAGGNVFYEKRGRDGELQTAEPKAADTYVLAYASANGAPAVAATVAPAAQAAPATAGETVVAALPAQTVVAGAGGKGPRNAGEQPVPAVSQPSVAPIIAAAVARANMDQAFDTAYSVPQNSSVTPAGVHTVSLGDVTVPVPAVRPDIKKRTGGGMAMAEPSYGTATHENWMMRTGDWQ